MKRREFLQNSALAAGAAMVSTLGTRHGPGGGKEPGQRQDRGVRGRHSRSRRRVLGTFAGTEGVEVRYVCDIDEQVLAERTKETNNGGRHQAEAIKDFRQALDDKSAHALVLGTPDHWHALPTIHACQAGKDVYVEKPDGHNIIEGRTMVAAAKKHGRIVQLGTQSPQRAALSLVHGVSEDRHARQGPLRQGLGKRAARLARQAAPTASRRRASTTTSGSAPRRSGRSTRPLPRQLAVVLRLWHRRPGQRRRPPARRRRWALSRRRLRPRGRRCPTCRGPSRRIGGKYYFDDAQEWPDTLMVTYDFARAT